MRPPDRERGRKLDDLLRQFARDKGPLPGISSTANRESFVEQLIESIRRVEFISAIAKRDISDLRAEPSSDLFDPVKASILCKRRGNIDEAF